MAEWVRVEAPPALREGEMVRARIGERDVALALNDGKLYAFSAACPHASADLTGGDLRPTYVICPLHAYRFELATGRCLKPRDGPRLRVFRVERRGEEVWVEL